MDPAVTSLAQVATDLQLECLVGEDIWEASPFGWIKRISSSRSRGSAAERVFSEWCVRRGIPVRRAPNSDADRIIGNRLAEIKMSSLWKAGYYRFQQIRNQQYEIAVFLGLSPFDAHCWVVPKNVLIEGIGHLSGLTPQHGGKDGRDTAWLTVRPDRIPVWLNQYGGRLEQALAILQK